MLCAIYCRLSREDEENTGESESIQNQKAILAEYAAQRNWEIYQIYCDEDYSGADRDRPAFCQMIQDAENHRFQLILCKTQSRFTRDMELVEKYIHGKFLLWGIRFIAVADHVDTGVQGGKKARQINGLVNEWYLEDLSENVRMVLDHKRKEGIYIGGFPLYGYKKHPTEKGRLVVDEEAAAVVRQIFHWAQAGESCSRIADLLNQGAVPNPTRYKQKQGLGYVNGGMTIPHGFWTRGTVRRILRNEMYLGTMVQGVHRKVSYKSKKLMEVPEDQWIRVADTHQPIIDQKTFFAVQNMRQSRKRPSTEGQPHILSGLVRCMDCGSIMSKTSNDYRSGSRSYLRCSLYAKSGTACQCTRHSIRYDLLLKEVEARIRLYLPNYPEEYLRPASSEKSNQLAVLKRQADKYDAALESLYLDKVSGLISLEQFIQLNDSFRREQSKLRVEIQRLSAVDAASSISLPYSSEPAGPGAPITRNLLCMLIDKIEIGERDQETGHQKVHIFWRF